MERNLVKKILGVTLARGGSKGIVNKNIIKLNGLPLIGYTIRESLKSHLIDDYIVSTDSPKISKISKKLGAQVPFLRPYKLSSSTATSASALQHAVKFMEDKNDCKYDFIVETMCTNPLKTYIDIDNCIKKIKKINCNAVIAVNQLFDHHPSRIKKIVNNRLVNFCIKEKKESRRQDLKPKAYIRSGSIYVMTRSYLMKQNRRHGNVGNVPYILPPERAINIDTKIDMLVAEHMIKSKNK